MYAAQKLETFDVEENSTTVEAACLKVENLFQPNFYRYVWLHKVLKDNGGKGHFKGPDFYKEDFFFPPHEKSQTLLTLIIHDAKIRKVSIHTKTSVCAALKP